jgi:hypothetical protein
MRMMPDRKKHIDAAPGGRITPSLLGDLLAFAARHPDAGIVHTFPASPAAPADERQVRYVQDAGLAPLLHVALHKGFVQVPDGCREPLRGADLAAQVRHANRIEVAAEVIDVCAALGVRATLLKGISISDQHYPAAHLRPMGDIDILVPAQAASIVEAELLRLGHQRVSNVQPRDGAHHGIPLHHPRRRAWTEIHTALFPADAGIDGALFSPSGILEHSVPSTFAGRPVFRFTPEFQLAYLATGWLRDLSGNAIHPTLAVPLFDAVYLLKSVGTRFDWDAVARSVDNDTTAAALDLMLTQLSRRGLCPDLSPFLSRLAQRPRKVGAIEARILHRMLEDHLIAGRPFPRYIGSWHAQGIFNTLLLPGTTAAKLLRIPWNMAFPPGIAERYDPRWQFRRIAALLRKDS